MGRPPLRSHDEIRRRQGSAAGHRVRASAAVLIALALPLLLSGCGSETLQRGWLPSTEDTTNQTGRIISLWNGSWIAAWAVGFLVWGLILWCVFAYRRRRDETGVPAQVRYNIPMEILYTVVPLMMVAVLFFYTARDQAAIASVEEDPDLTINVVGKQWSWDFNYVDDGVYESGVQAQLNGEPGVAETAPTLYLPVNERVQFVLTARDVIHSFWIPAFLYKLDTIPGTTNTFQVVPQREGDFVGKCAELCGEFHSEMLFNVKVVDRSEYDAHIADLRSRGQTGSLETNLGRSDTVTEDNADAVESESTP